MTDRTHLIGVDKRCFEGVNPARIDRFPVDCELLPVAEKIVPTPPPAPPPPIDPGCFLPVVEIFNTYPSVMCGGPGGLLEYWASPDTTGSGSAGGTGSFTERQQNASIVVDKDLLIAVAGYVEGEAPINALLRLAAASGYTSFDNFLYLNVAPANGNNCEPVIETAMYSRPTTFSGRVDVTSHLASAKFADLVANSGTTGLDSPSTASDASEAGLSYARLAMLDTFLSADYGVDMQALDVGITTSSEKASLIEVEHACEAVMEALETEVAYGASMLGLDITDRAGGTCRNIEVAIKGEFMGAVVFGPMDNALLSISAQQATASAEDTNGYIPSAVGSFSMQSFSKLDTYILVCNSIVVTITAEEPSILGYAAHMPDVTSDAYMDYVAWRSATLTKEWLLGEVKQPVEDIKTILIDVLSDAISKEEAVQRLSSGVSIETLDANKPPTEEHMAYVYSKLTEPPETENKPQGRTYEIYCA